MIAIVALLGSAASLAAKEKAAPVKTIGAYVLPYYDDGTWSGRVKVSVGKDFDRLLESGHKKDILEARDLIEARADRATPMTLMVLAIRLYDVGLRDDAVYWFYVARYRFITLVRVLDDPALASAIQSSRDFVSTVGPFINSYAFCNPDKQAAASDRAIRWVEDHPYAVLFIDDLHSLPGDRLVNVRSAIAEIRKMQAENIRAATDPVEAERFRKARVENRVDEQYCW